MRIILFNILVFILTSSVYAQEESPVVWNKAFLHNTDNTIDLTFIAVIKDGWHLYSQTLDSDKGPIPTSFMFTDTNDFELVGKTKETTPHIKYDPNFEMDIAMFDGQAMFVQKLKSTSDSFSVSGKISFMVCNDEQCIFPPEEEFIFVKEGKELSYKKVVKQ